tara:strand:+ start:632 stop:934 length:303 start_codon:yes stop_codon:yes gene_type:complete
MLKENTESKNSFTSGLVEKFVSYVSQLRSITTEPLLTSVKWVIYGLAALICSFAALTFFAIGIFRLLNQAIPGGNWSAYLFISVIFCVSGSFLIKKCLQH